MEQDRDRGGKRRKVNYVAQNASIYSLPLDLGNFKDGPTGACVVWIANQGTENGPGLTKIYFSPYFLLRIPILVPLCFLSEKEMATHSSVLAWRIPGAGEPGALTSIGSGRVGHS